MSMSAIDENYLSNAWRNRLVAVAVAAALIAIAGAGSTWLGAIRSEEAAAEQTRPTTEYTRLEFAKAIERVFRGD
ncbi:MAG: hypothetical protein D4S02_10980 [Rhodocyclaceae bacterium]|nr:MAG: hypothetical protein D4S02_10980 [Rhodocyclaceae bacterium]